MTTEIYVTRKELQELEWYLKGVWQTFLIAFVIAHHLQGRVSINRGVPFREIKKTVAKTVTGKVEGTIPGKSLPLKALVIDSDSTARSSLSSALSQADFEMMIAADCIEGLVKLEQGQPHLAILADELPGVEQLCFQIRQSFDVPIILLGSKLGEQAWERASLFGADAYLTKSIGKSELVARAKAILRRYRREEENNG